MHHPQKFRIVTWNIERGIKLDKIAKVLCKKIQADIYALQEVDVHAYRSRYRDVATELASALGMPYIFGKEFREFAQEGYGSNHAFHGQEFISKFPVSNSETFYFPHQFRDWSKRWFHKPIIFSRLPRLQTKLIQNVGSMELGYAVAHTFQPRKGGRMALFGEFNIGDRELFVYNAHLESHASDAQKALQMQDILCHLDGNEKIKENDAIVILGDLNNHLGADSPVIKVAEERGLKDALLDFESRNMPTSHDGKRIDWILIKNLKAINCFVFKGGFEASDHLPVVAELEFINL